MNAAIECHGLSKRYGDVLALDRLDLSVPAGAVFGFLGPNGAGKTTLARILTGLVRPTAGTASVAGLDAVTSGLALHRRISALDQHPQYYGWMRGRELLTLVGELFGMRGAALRSRVDETLAITDLTDAANRRIGGYSGGMRQRLGLAQALINRPEVLFLDEPASALDPAGRHDILGVIAGLRGQATVFMSTHILADVERICDHVAIVNKGQLVVASTVEELQERYAQPIFTIELDSGQEVQMARLAQSLEAQPWVSEVRADGVTIRVVVHDEDIASHAIMPLLGQSDAVVQRFERGRPRLEDIFLRLVGGTSSEAAS